MAPMSLTLSDLTDMINEERRLEATPSANACSSRWVMYAST
jgi:hypothetical protein